jgi:uncharacterized protein
MIQPPRPGDLTDLETQEAVAYLEAAPWVRIGFIVEGAPIVLPINVLLHEEAIYFRTSAGSKLGTAASSGRVVIQADGGDESTRIGWSVLVHGEATIVTDPRLEEKLFALPFEPWALPDDRPFWVEVSVRSMSGRRIVRD